MRRSRAALTLFLGALAAALQTAGFAEVPPGLTGKSVAKTKPINCYADAPVGPIVRPVAFAEDWYLDVCHPGYGCYGPHGADCYQGPGLHTARHEPVLLDAKPIDEYEYAYEWDCEAYCDECDAYLVTPRVHLEDLSHLAADSRHSQGQADALRINRENEGLQAGSLSVGDHPHDLPAGESFYVSRVVTDRVGSSFDCDDHCPYAGAYDAWDDEAYASDCRQDEPGDLPLAETELHVARQEAPAGHEYSYGDDYEYDYSYDYSQYGEDETYANDDYTGVGVAEDVPPSAPASVEDIAVEPADLTGDEELTIDATSSEEVSADAYRYDDAGDYDYGYDYSQYGEDGAYANDDSADAVVVEEVTPSAPAFTDATAVEPADLPSGEEVTVDLPSEEASPEEYRYNDDSNYSYSYDEYAEPYAADASEAAQPAFSGASKTEPADLPAAEHASGDLPVGEFLTDDLPEGEDLVDDMPAAEPVANDLPESGFDDAAVPCHEVISGDLPEGEEINDLPPEECPCPGREAYRNDYESEYDYDYRCDCSYDAQPYTHAAPAVDIHSTRLALRAASWMLSHMGETLLGLSRSVEEMADADTASESAQLMPPEVDYPWPTIIGRQPDHEVYPGL